MGHNYCNWLIMSGVISGVIVDLGGRVLLGVLGGGVPPRSTDPDPISDLKMALFTPIFRPGL